MTVSVSRPFDLTGSVNDLLRDHPSSIVALNALGIDTCCGGDLSLPDAARHAGVSFDRLVGDIDEALRSDAR